MIVTAEFGTADFAWLDGLRRRHYPPERNRVPAHLTIVRSLPPSAEAETRRALARVTTTTPPRACASGLINLGGGVAIRIRSDDLDEVRWQLVGCFHGLLSAPDRGGWIAHVTIQNKVDPIVARTLLHSLEKDFSARPVAIKGLQLISYSLGGWKMLARYPFRGVS